MQGLGASSSNSSRYEFDVFLCFRGEDTRNNFTDHLYQALERKGIRTFRDNDKIRRGERMETKIRNAILKSHIAIVVLSENFASSRWCLDELVQIMESPTKHNVEAVYYKVTPSQVRNQTGSYEQSFSLHESNSKFGVDKVRKWRAALEDVAGLKGMELKDRPETEFIDKIVKGIQRKLDLVVVDVIPHLVGRDEIINDINVWVQNGEDKVGIGTVYGIRGVGKTTIAKSVFCQNYHNFEGSCFLSNVRETSGEVNGMLSLQKQLLSSFYKGEKIKIQNVDQGAAAIRTAVRGRKFLVFDDVDEKYQFDAIIKMQEWCGPGSKIIITTTYQPLVSTIDCKNFRVSNLGNEESLMLFSWHAFHQYHPEEAYIELSKSIVKQCGGLPLALELLGSSLANKRNMDIWQDILERSIISHSSIHKALRISYDTLKDDHDKHLFLDISCFFIGRRKDHVVTILKGCGFYPTSGIQNLVDRCLMFIDEHKKIQMHQLLRDMGREIVRQESPQDPEKRSRLWNDEDAFYVLKEKSGTISIRGLSLDVRMLKQGEHMSTNACRASEKVKKHIETTSFHNMRKLQLLQINHARLLGNYEAFPKRLVWLAWHGSPLESISTDMCLEKLVVLEMSNSKLKSDWKEGKLLENMKILDLSHCYSFIKSPDLSGLPNLEKLMLRDCINLIEIGDSVGYLTKLVELNLKGCRNLQHLSTKIEMVRSLETLVLSGCSKLFEIPSRLGTIESLRLLYLDGSGTGRYQSALTKMGRMKTGFLPWLFPRSTPHSISFSIGYLPCFLVKLHLSYCNLSDEDISINFRSLPLLKVLDLEGNPFWQLPESTGKLEKLECLRISDCKNIKHIPQFPQKRLCIRIFNYATYFAFQHLFKISPITTVDVEIINKLGLSNLEPQSRQVIMYCNYSGVPSSAPLQVLHEEGISSIYALGNEIPSWYTYRGTASSFSFNVLLRDGHKFRGFNICIPYSTMSRTPSVEIKIETKDFRQSYWPSIQGKPIREQDDMLWLSHWRLDEILEVGDNVTIFFENQQMGWGVHPVYEAEYTNIQFDNEQLVPQETLLWHSHIVLRECRYWWRLCPDV